jgi:hypothetical protein
MRSLFAAGIRGSDRPILFRERPRTQFAIDRRHIAPFAVGRPRSKLVKPLHVGRARNSQPFEHPIISSPVLGRC